MPAAYHDFPPRPIPAHEYRRERWHNGHGWTREIARWPESGDWDWRLSIAEVEAPAPFSRFDGVARELVLLSGNGLRLRFDDGETHELLPPHGRLRFAGTRAVTGEPIDGPTHDFNLMWREDRIDARLLHRPLVGAMVVFVEAGECWALHLLAGHLAFADGAPLPALAAGDTVLLTAPTARTRYVIDGGGEALLIQLTPRTSG